MSTTDEPTFFNPHQRATVEAAMARIIPTDEHAGAREAGTIDFLERYLSGIGYVYALPDGSGFEELHGRQAQAWQQRIDLAREKYVHGVTELDRLAQQRHGSPFVDLAEDQQDAVLRSIEDPSAETGAGASRGAHAIAYGGPVEPALQQTNTESELEFFPLLVAHTRQGFLADPVYGGNRDRLGWRAIGFPGPSSLAQVHTGQYNTLDYFAENRVHRGQEETS